MRPSIMALIFLMLALLIVGPTEKVLGQNKSDPAIAETYPLLQETINKGNPIITGMERNNIEIEEVVIHIIGDSSSDEIIKIVPQHFGYSPNRKYIISAVGLPSRIAILDLEISHITSAGNSNLIKRGKLDYSVDSYDKYILDMTYREAGEYRIKVIASKMVPGYNTGYYFLAIGHN